MTGLYHVEVLPRIGKGLIDSRGESIRRQLMTDHDIVVAKVRSTLGYLVKGELDTINAIISDNPPDEDYLQEDVQETVVIEPVNNQLLDEESEEESEDESETVFVEKQATTKENNYYESEEFLNL